MRPGGLLLLPGAAPAVAPTPMMIGYGTAKAAGGEKRVRWVLLEVMGFLRFMANHGFDTFLSSAYCGSPRAKVWVHTVGVKTHPSFSTAPRRPPCTTCCGRWLRTAPGPTLSRQLSSPKSGQQ